MKMMTFLMAGLFLSLGCSTPHLSAQDAESAPAFFAVSGSSEVSGDQFAAIQRFVRKELAVELHEIEVDLHPGSLDELAEQLVDHVPQRALAVIALIDPEEGPDTHSTYRYDDRLALIHVPAVTRGAEGDQAYYRVERLVMRALAFLTGFDQSPDPFSVMAPYRTLEDLDRRGRNFSPPDTFKFQQQAREKGVALLEPSPLLAAPEDQ